MKVSMHGIKYLTGLTEIFSIQVVLTDVTNQVIFATKDSGQTMQQYKVDFHPSDVLFHDDDPFTFLAYDKVDPLKKVFCVCFFFLVLLTCF